MLKNNPIEVTHLFHKLDEKLIVLLKSLTEEEWQMQTVAKLWKVKDVAGHLLVVRLEYRQEHNYFIPIN